MKEGIRFERLLSFYCYFCPANKQSMKKVLFFLVFSCVFGLAKSQINTDRVLNIGRNALYFEDYVLSIQYFNQVIKAKPYLAEPYFYRAIAKYNLDDFKGAELDASLCLERNQFLSQAYELRGAARQNQEEYRTAIEDYSKGLEFNPENRQLLFNKSIAQLQLKDFTEAEQDIDLLIKYHPRYTRAYLLRSSLQLEKKDTLAALASIERALSIDKYYAPLYDQRAIISFYKEDYQQALNDLNEAIRLEPRNKFYYIRRSLSRYYLDDLRGAMSDYDIVISMDANNLIARFNRGLLRAQVGDDNNAIADFDVVIQQEPDNLMAIYNRGLLKEQIGDLKGALSDINRVLEEYPSFATGYHIRSDIRKRLRDLNGAEKDYWTAFDLQRKANQGELADNDKQERTREESDKTIEKFNRLVVYDKTSEEKSKYNSELRGRVQDKNVVIDLESSFIITYYEKLEEVERSNYYDRTLDELNKQLAFRMRLILTNAEAPLTDEQVDIHFKSVDEFSRQISQNPENVNAYLGRALDFMVVQDLSASIEDYTKVIDLSPSLSLAYFNRAMVREKQLEIVDFSDEGISPAKLNVDLGAKTKSTPLGLSANASLKDQAVDKQRKYQYELIMRDYDQVIKLSPNFAFAYFNRGNLFALQKDFKPAIANYTDAIKLEPELAEAYFNRGLARLSIGDNQRGLEDLSKAGELGLPNAYSIIKRMTAE